MKLPVAYTVFPTVAMLHTTPFTCQVGSGSALTVGGVPGWGAVSAAAGPAGTAVTPSSAVQSAVTVAAAARRTGARVKARTLNVRFPRQKEATGETKRDQRVEAKINRRTV
nr:hypothetical protein GCM10010200_060670 [Actinomadura rugatobispora]